MDNVFTQTPAALRLGAVFGVPEDFDASVGELAGMVGLADAAEVTEAAREALGGSKGDRRAVFARLASSVPVGALQSLPEQTIASYATLFAVLSASLYSDAPADFAPLLERWIDTLAALPATMGPVRFQACVAAFAIDPDTVSLVTLENAFGGSEPVSRAVLAGLVRMATASHSTNDLESIRPILTSSDVRRALAADDSLLAAVIKLLIDQRDFRAAFDLLSALPAVPTALAPTYARLALALPGVFALPAKASAALPQGAERAALTALSGGEGEIESSLFEPADGIELAKDAVERKLRAARTATVLRAHVGRRVSYDDLATALGVGSGGELALQLERRVIEAVRSKLVVARLSQPERTVTVVSVVALGQDDDAARLELVTSRLRAWRSELDSILRVVDQVSPEVAVA